MKNTLQAKQKTIPYHLAAIFIVLIAAIAITGYFFYQDQKEHIKKAKQEELNAIADLKVEQISAWREERFRDASFIFNNPQIARQINEFLYHPASPLLKKELPGWMTSMYRNRQYISISITDINGKVLVSVPEDNNRKQYHVKKYLNEALKTKKIFFSDLYRNENSNIFMDIVVPVIISQETSEVPVALVVLRIDPYQFLYPLIQSWPIPSNTAETLIIRRDGDDALFLNEVRHRKDTALSLRILLSKKDVPAAMAGRGETGVFEGIDYRGIPALAAIQPVPDSTWFMVAKVDMKEVFAPFRVRFRLIIILIIVLIGTAGLGIRFIWRNLEAESFRRELEEHKRVEERVKRQSLLLMAINRIFKEALHCETEWELGEACLTVAEELTDSKFGFIGELEETGKFSDIALSNPGWDECTMPESDKAKLIKHMEIVSYWGRTMKEGKSQIVNEPLSDPDSRGIPGGHPPITSFLGVPLKRNEKIIGMIALANKTNGYTLEDQENIENISSSIVEIFLRKRAEEALQQAHKRIRSFIDANIVGVVIAGASGKVIEANDYYLDTIGYAREEFERGMVDWRAITPPEWLPADEHAIEELREKGVCTPYEKEYIRRDGTRVSVFLSDAMLPGTEEQFAAFVLDITERKQLEHEREKFVHLADSSSEFIGMCDLEMNPVYVNPAGIRMVGLSDMRAACNVKVQDYFFPEDQDFIRDEFFPRVLREGHGDIEIRLRHFQTGEPIWMFYYLFHVCDANGTPIGWATVSRDITEHKRIEEALRESEDKFKYVFESANVGKSITLPTGEINVNKAFADLLGYSKEEMQNKTWQELTPPDEIEAIQKMIDPLLNGEKDSVRFDKRYIHENGSHIWADVSVAIRRNSDGKPLHFITTIVDITERKRKEEELRLSEALFSNAFHIGPAGMTITRVADGRFIDVNESFCEMFGLNRDEVIGHTSTELNMWTPEERRRLMHKQLESGGLYNFELLARTKSGKLINILFSSKEMQLKGETCHLTIMIDITGRKQAEEELSLTNEELLAINRIITTTTTTTGVKEILNKVIDEILNIAGLEGGTICLVSDNTLKLAIHRATSESVIKDLSEGQIRIGECLCGECAKDHKTLILWNRNEVLEYSTREATRGEDIRFHAAFPIVIGDKCLGVLCIFTRTETKPTERKLKLLEAISSQIAIAVDNARMFEEISHYAAKLEDKVRERTAELEQSNARLKALDRLKSMFIASMSHELRTPLNSVIGFSSILLNQWKGRLNNEQLQFASIILKAGKHLLSLVNDVIDVSKIEADMIDTRVEDFELYDVIEEAVESLTREVKDKGLAVTVKSIHQIMHTDKNRLLQCILNLLSNAVKFTLKGNITVQTRLVNSEQYAVNSNKEKKELSTDDYSLMTDRNFVEISIEDSGIGIKKEDIPKLFNAFVRLDSPLRTKVLGTGLGLYLTRKLLTEVLKGDIVVESEYGEGSKFIIRVPVKIQGQVGGI